MAGYFFLEYCVKKCVFYCCSLHPSVPLHAELPAVSCVLPPPEGKRMPCMKTSC